MTLSDGTPVFPCLLLAGLTVHITAGTSDGKRGRTLCGLSGALEPAETVEHACQPCARSLDTSRLVAH
jgi:hypothetical protein